jgi:hypothetical protein
MTSLPVVPDSIAYDSQLGKLDWIGLKWDGYAINRYGHIVGVSEQRNSAFVADPGGVNPRRIWLGNHSSARDVKGDGVVVGGGCSGNVQDGGCTGFNFYSEAQGKNARVLPVPCDESDVGSLNKWGYVVGYCIYPQTLPFMIHLPDLKLVDLRTQVVMPPGMALTAAMKINAVGMIVAGVSNGHLFLLIPRKQH